MTEGGPGVAAIVELLRSQSSAREANYINKLYDT
jgi:hypothetical protein